MNPEWPLPTFRLDTDVALSQASPWHQQPVTLASPAMQVMTDLTRVKAATVSPDRTLAQAEQAMVYLGVRMLFVVSHMPQIEGLVTSHDVRGERPMRRVHERGVHFDELCVADVMTPMASLDAVDFDGLRSATVGNLVVTLRRSGRHHLLVVEQARGSTPRRVRGVVSLAQIERQLGTPLGLTEIARDFAEIEQALA